MIRSKVLTIAASGGMVLAIALSSPVAAFEVIKQSGQTGDWGVRSGNGEAKCAYSGPASPQGTTLKSIRVYPVLAQSATGSPQRVSWTVVIQKSTNSGSTWQTIKTGPTQTDTATASSSVSFKRVTVAVSGKLNVLYRAVSTLKWLTNGNATGLIKFRMQDYLLRIGHNDTGQVAEDYCYGKLFD